MHVPLGFSSRLSRIECPSGSLGPQAPVLGWAGWEIPWVIKRKRKKRKVAKHTKETRIKSHSSGQAKEGTYTAIPDT